MNTDRPDNDDAAAEAGAAETAGDVRNTKGASGSDGENGVPEVPGAQEQEGAPEEKGSIGAETSEAGTSEAETAEAPASKVPASKVQASKPQASDARISEAQEAGAEGRGTPDADGARAEGARAEGARTGDARAEGARTGDARADDARADEADAERSARRRSPAIIASVTAAVLLVGGGGAYLAASAAGGSGGGTTSGAPGGDGTPPPLDLDGYSAPQGGTNGIAPGEQNPYGITYKADGTLPDGPGSAPVYRTQGEVAKEQVARLAKALGMDGTPVAEGQLWKVGSGKDGSGPSLQVNKQAPGAWSFDRYAPGSDNCQKETVCPQSPADPGGDPVSPEAAQKAAAPVLQAMGQDEAKRDASQVLGAQRVVNADPVVGGLPTYGWSTGLMVSAQGEVVGGSGRLKAPVKSDTYPVLGAQKTLELMNAAPGTDHRMGIGGCASPVPLKDRLEAPCGSSTAAPEKTTLTVEKAVFGLASHSVAGRQALVPSWLFEVRPQSAQDAFTVTYPAIDPKYLASSTPSGEPTGQPSPRPTEPGDEPTSAPASRDVEVEGYAAEGTELTVTFTGGVCADYEAKASESADKVTVTVTETPWPNKICIMIAKQYQQTVQLDEPLGDREVVGSDGKAVPLQKPGARLPSPPERTRR